ncbi:cytochrome b562 [Vibrio sagamiensis]|uniref:Cytochrome b562 family protein n=1 Tax=Vibrio sagamiensis NBRC 104589 TaxID=1219064 RepID=A0A511QD06_9VIBR|nr:cytochrome b562 [Vibrio sagamiensis]GEM75173.1 cytochrome b562 family protein [Vibrio sagamiensis NBRC 104589]
MLRFLLIGSLMVFNTSAEVQETIDLKINMKKMKLEFYHAVQASEIGPMMLAIDHMQSIVEQSKKGKFSPEKSDIYNEGFNKLSLVLKRIKNDLENGDFTKAKEGLYSIESLRQEYHDKRSPSIWSKIFG